MATDHCLKKICYTYCSAVFPSLVIRIIVLQNSFICSTNSLLDNFFECITCNLLPLSVYLTGQIRGSTQITSINICYHCAQRRPLIWTVVQYHGDYFVGFKFQLWINCYGWQEETTVTGIAPSLGLNFFMTNPSNRTRYM